MNIEIEFDSLEQARERGPELLVERCEREGLRLLSQPTYCERDGRGVMSAEVAGPPPIITNDPAPSEAAEHNGDDK